MAELLNDSKLVAAIEALIDDADKFLWLISPYISLHQRVRDKLKLLTRNKPWVEIIVVFGKNEDDMSKSISADDMEFLKQLPNIQICYEKRLHAKFYASEDALIVTSMNLHHFSQNNNIEIGLRFKSGRWQLGNTDIDSHLLTYFYDIISNATELYMKVPKFESSLLGISQQYTGSKVEHDETELFFKANDFKGKPRKFFKQHVKGNENSQSLKVSYAPNTGFCIRTGKPIPFNPERPLSAEAYKSWSQYKNPDFPEKYCHRTGKASNGQTSVRKPVLF